MVILESKSVHPKQDCDNNAEAEISVLSEFPNESILSISSSNPGYLVMSDVWYPGWQSSVDGKQETLMHANYLFRSIQIPAGEHEVKISYRPKWLYFGAVINGASVILLVGLGIFWFAKKRSLG